MAIQKVLIVENDSTTRRFLEESFQGRRARVSAIETLEAALELLTEQHFDLLIAPIHTPTRSGLELLERVKAAHPQTVAIFTTAITHVEKAVEAIRQGAFNYLITPFSAETLQAMLRKAEEHASLIEENRSLRQEISVHRAGKIDQIITESTLMKHILQDVAKIAKSNASVFISGESGTGKEVIAHAIHCQSARSGAAFVKVNCAAIPETLIESEFFGHEKGSFTGALHKRLGRFELADKGTLLLDEISEVPLALQSKLLRAIQEQEFERVGGIDPIRVDVRLISTSNRNMKEAIEQKIFREDLYYRLNVVPLQLPPLRERKEDILPLAEYFLERLCMENHKQRKRLSAEARKKLLAHYWPGNIRELANIIERTVVMDCADLIQPEHLFLDPFTPRNAKCPVSPYPQTMTLQEVEKRHILDTLASYHDNRAQTAKALGISIRTLRNKLTQYNA